MSARLSTVVVCDGCGAMTPTVTSDSPRTRAVRLDARKAGWTLVRPERRFDPTYDYCPVCTGEHKGHTS